MFSYKIRSYQEERSRPHICIYNSADCLSYLAALASEFCEYVDASPHFLSKVTVSVTFFEKLVDLFDISTHSIKGPSSRLLS